MENENEISDPKEIANKFNDYFANIGKSIASEIPIACKDPMAYLGNPVCNSFYLFPTWSGKIETEINNLKSGKSSGPSSIPVQMKRKSCVSYLGVLIDSTLSWKNQIEYVSKKIRRSIGILCKLRYFVTRDILINLYYALIYPFLIYGLISWGNTYESNFKPIYILQKKALRIITFSAFDHPSSPLFKSLGITKFF